MNALVRGLTWPFVSLLIVGGTHFVGEAMRPELRDLIGPAVVIPIYLVVGAWAALRTIDAGGSFVSGLVAGALLGLLPVALQLVGFGAILGRDSAATITAAVFGFVGIFWGAAIGAAYAMSRPNRASLAG